MKNRERGKYMKKADKGEKILLGVVISLIIITFIGLIAFVYFKMYLLSIFWFVLLMANSCNLGRVIALINY